MWRMFYIAYPLILLIFCEFFAAEEAKFIPNPNLLVEPTEKDALPLILFVN